MALNPEMRASDGDRDRTAAALREHCAQGRITVDELNDRLDATYTAVTIGELERVTGDLPEEDMYELPVPASRRSTPARRGTGAVARPGNAAGWSMYGTVTLICIVSWLIGAVSSGVWYPWFLWVAGPWGAMVLAGKIFGPRGGGR